MRPRSPFIVTCRPLRADRCSGCPCSLPEPPPRAVHLSVSPWRSVHFGGRVPLTNQRACHRSRSPDPSVTPERSPALRSRGSLCTAPAATAALGLPGAASSGRCRCVEPCPPPSEAGLVPEPPLLVHPCGVCARAPVLFGAEYYSVVRTGRVLSLLHLSRALGCPHLLAAGQRCCCRRRSSTRFRMNTCPRSLGSPWLWK